MNRSTSLLGQFVSFVSYVILQIVLAQAVMPIHRARCFIYVGILLFMPWQRTNQTLQLLLAFVIGLLMDAYYNTLGIHSFAAVLITYLRTLLTPIMVPTSSYIADIRPSIRSMGFKKFSIFILMLLFIHHTAVFFLEACNGALFLVTIRKVISSTLFTYFTICSVQAFSSIIVGRK